MDTQHIVIVTGGRRYAYPSIVHLTLNTLYVKHGPFTLFHGACKPRGSSEMVGADRYADDWGQPIADIEVVPFEADWDRYGDDAGPIRNRLMVVTAVQRVPRDHIHGLAFPEPRSRGTWNCVNIMKEFDIIPEEWAYAAVRRWQSNL